MNPMMAAKAYAAVQGGAMPTAAQAPGVGDGGFADLVKNAMTDMTQQSRAAETQMTRSVQGQGNLIDVVTALSSAEASLETVISVRDIAKPRSRRTACCGCSAGVASASPSGAPMRKAPCGTTTSTGPRLPSCIPSVNTWPGRKRP